ncbi:uncharacterized protein LOC129567275 [Sitodiplosis mosellana]|uniref:uncharacterized protein LOC129567275 n=1 Tax=Sitodiplosis mosellana TaxID=263140 RepID=UPI002443B9D0|nr:uncharacterized protein LOC129567275 [Sitodiplosis mosellana]
MSDLEKLSTVLNSELEVILSNSDGSDEVKKYLKTYVRFSLLRRYIKCMIFVLIAIATVCASIYYIPILNWNASAIGRLVLIKHVLPYYDWQHLYKSRCLVEKFGDGKTTSTEEYNDYGELNRDDCAVCENLVSIDRVSDATFGLLQDVYLSRDHPVIINDSHGIWPNQPDVLEDFIEFLLSSPNLKYSTPCNIGTNLVQIRDDSPKLQYLLRQTGKVESKGWFLHFRNCDFEAVKASRATFSLKNRPYFISSHLPPFHTSWIILSKHYGMPIEKRLPVKDLVIVLQLNGQISGRLTTLRHCKDFCLDHNFELNAGEALVFNAQMWNFYYRNIDLQANLTITFIQEIHAD